MKETKKRHLKLNLIKSNNAIINDNWMMAIGGIILEYLLKV